MYGDDRVFVRLSGGHDAEWQRRSDAALDALADAGHPVIDLAPLPDGRARSGAEFFRWEFATAVAGAVLGINPFDEPNVTESKDNTRRVLEEYRHAAQLPAEETLTSDGALRLIGDAPLRLTAGHDGLAKELRRHLERARTARLLRAPGVHRADATSASAGCASIATLLRDRSGRPVTVGFGPRFLHSTGQLHKGGPPSGCFLQLTAEHPDDLPIHGWHESFGTLIDAQAVGDFISLETHELPVARINLAADPDAGLEQLRAVFERRSASHSARRTGVDLAIVGLGRMGSNMARRLHKAGHRVVAYNRSRDKTDEIIGEGLEGGFTPQQVIDMLRRATRRVADGPRRRRDRADDRRVRRSARARRHDHRRRQRQLQGFEAPPRACSRSAASSSSTPASVAASGACRMATEPWSAAKTTAVQAARAHLQGAGTRAAATSIADRPDRATT